MVSMLDFGADDPGSIPDVGAGKENLFSCCLVPILATRGEVSTCTCA